MAYLEVLPGPSLLRITRSVAAGEQVIKRLETICHLHCTNEKEIPFFSDPK